jgi:hypothetical protein
MPEFGSDSSEPISRTGTPQELQSWLVSSGGHPDAIQNLWLDPISDQLRCSLTLHDNTNYGEPVRGFKIAPAEGAIIHPGNWQPFGDPIPVWPYPGRDPTHHPDRPAPAYYQPLIWPVHQSATHLHGVLRWTSAHAPASAPRAHPRDPLRLVHPSLLGRILASKTDTLLQHPGPMLPYDYNTFRVAARAPPWHPNAGFYTLVPAGAVHANSI